MRENAEVGKNISSNMNRNSNNNDDDEEQRIRDRLRAKLESRSSKQTSSGSNSKLTSGDGSKVTKSESYNRKGDSPTSKVDAKDNNNNGNKTVRKETPDSAQNEGQNGTRRRRRRHRSRGRRNRRGHGYGGGAGGPPPPSHVYHTHRGYGPPPIEPYSYGPPYVGPPPRYAGPPPPLPPPGYDWRPRGRYGEMDDFGRKLPPRMDRDRSPRESYHRRGSHSRSHSRSRSQSRSRSRGKRSRSRSVSSSASESTSSTRSSRSSSRSSRSVSDRSTSSSGSSRSYTSNDDKSHGSSSKESSVHQQDTTYTKDQRTVFVTQLIMRTTERDIAKFFKKQGIKTNEIILLRDKRTGRHKGSAYVELRHIFDVSKSLELSGKPPDFQRFPILIKVSEAEKNYLLANKSSTPTATTTVPEAAAAIAAVPVTVLKPVGHPIAPPLVGPNGKLMQAQKLYVGNLDPSVSQEHLFALFNPFGQLEQVNLQKNESGISKGFAFLQFRDPREANLALQTMSGRMLVGRPIKTGWANQVSANPNVEVVTSQEFPEDSTNRAQTAYLVLAQLTSGVNLSTSVAAASTVPVVVPVQQPDTSNGLVGIGGISRVPTVAEARASLAAAHGASRVGTVPFVASSVLTTTGSTVDPTKIGNAENPSKTVLVHNMFDKDEETELGWENDIRDEFQEECSKYGKIISVQVIHKEPGGKIYATFDSINGAQNCASNLAGRWFDKRQLRVEYVCESAVPSTVGL